MAATSRLGGACHRRQAEVTVCSYRLGILPADETQPFDHAISELVESEMPPAQRPRNHREGVLLAQPFNARRLELMGEPVALAEHIGSYLRYGFFSTSTNGALLSSRVLERDLHSHDRARDTLNSRSSTAAVSCATLRGVSGRGMEAGPSAVVFNSAPALNSPRCENRRL
jgi:hypothetical protein